MNENSFSQKLKSLFHSRKVKYYIFVLIILIPAAIWFIVFMFYPIFLCFKMSFFNTNMAYNTDKFIGLENYVRLFSDPVFLISLKNTIFAVIYIVPATIILAFLLALLLNSFSDRIREGFTLIYFLPNITSMVAISVVWKWLYNPAYGLFNYILELVGMAPMEFINSSSQALPSITTIQVWRSIGFYAVILLAALRGISKTYYEAAIIDGANKFELTRHITIPLLKPALTFTSIMATMEAFKIFDSVKMMTDGGPGNSTMVIVLYTIRQGIYNMELGYASSVAVVMFIIVMVITFLQWKIIKEK